MFVNRAEKGEAQGLLQDANEAVNSNVRNNPHGLFSGGIGSALSGGLDRLMGMFGGNSNSIISAISNFASIKSGSVQGLLGMLAPPGLGALGRHAQENNLSAQGLKSYLSSQKSSIMSALHAGLSLGNLFGDHTKTVHAATGTGDIRSAHRMEVERDVKRTNWLPWLLLGLGALALLWYLGKNGCNKTDNVATTTDTTNQVTAAPMDTSTTATMPATTGRESTKVKLADGTEINA
jgi:OmpA-OmpF porin, OOP family